MDLELPLAFEIGSLVVLTLILVADLLIILKRPHIPSTRKGRDDQADRRMLSSCWTARTSVDRLAPPRPTAPPIVT